MTYLALARKWRPKRFEEVVGQQHVLSAMINSLDNQTLHHAYLFCGTRGVGKTSLARLFAKSLNCEVGISSKPCGECSSCVDIDRGNFVDLLEIDAASRTKVEDTRELLDNVQYSPARGRYKVYLIDEVHMLSRHSFNALLKTLEEPPEHVKFLLATTDPQKLPITVLSRCLQFQLKALTRDQILHHLEYIVQVESIEAEPRALELLAAAAHGSMRDAQSLMDQALALGGGRVQYASVLDMLGHLDPHQIKQLLCFVIAGEAQQAFAKVQELSLLAPDYGNLHQQLAQLLHDIALAQVLVGGSQDDTVSVLAQRCDAELIQLLYQIVITGKRDLDYAPSPRSGFEMTLLRMLAFEPAPKQMNAPLNVVDDLGSQETLGNSLYEEQAAIQAQAQMLMADTGPAMSEPSTYSPVAMDAQTQLPGQGVAMAAPRTETPTVDVLADEVIAPHDAYPDEAYLSDLAQDELDAASFRDDAYFDPEARLVPAFDTELALPSADLADAKSPNEAPAPEQTQVAVPANDVASSRTQDLLKMRSMLRSQTRGKSDSKKTEDRSLVQTQAPVVLKPVASCAKPIFVSCEENVQTDVRPAQLSDHDAPPWPIETLASQCVAPSPVPSQTCDFAKQVAIVDALPVVDSEMAAPPEIHPWGVLIDEMELGPICRQVALNSLYSEENGQIVLLVKPAFGHLLKDSVVDELNRELSRCLGRQLSPELQLGEDNLRTTPLEHQHVMHQYKLEQARRRLMSQESVQFLVERMGAQLIDESVQFF
jgi:DNA polymerase-3 subunit gamma/tau